MICFLIGSVYERVNLAGLLVSLKNFFVVVRPIKLVRLGVILIGTILRVRREEIVGV